MTKEEFKQYYELDEKILDRMFSIGREFAKKLDICYGYSRNIHEKSGARIEFKKYNHEFVELLELTDEDICDDQCVDRLIQQRQEKIDKLSEENNNVLIKLNIINFIIFLPHPRQTFTRIGE